MHEATVLVLNFWHLLKLQNRSS